MQLMKYIKIHIMVIFLSAFIVLPSFALGVPQIDVDNFVYPGTPNLAKGSAVDIEPDPYLRNSIFPLRLGMNLTSLDSLVKQQNFFIDYFQERANKDNVRLISYKRKKINSKLELVYIFYDSRYYVKSYHPIALYLFENGLSVGYAVIDPMYVHRPKELPLWDQIKSLPTKQGVYLKWDKKKHRPKVLKKDNHLDFTLVRVNRHDGLIEEYGYLIDANEERESLILRSFFDKKYQKMMRKKIGEYLKKQLLAYIDSDDNDSSDDKDSDDKDSKSDDKGSGG